MRGRGFGNETRVEQVQRQTCRMWRGLVGAAAGATAEVSQLGIKLRSLCQLFFRLLLIKIPKERT